MRRATLDAILHAIYGAGVVAIIALLTAAQLYDAPVISGSGRWVYVEQFEGRQAGEVWIEDRDYSNAPLYVKAGKEYGLIPAVLGVILLILWYQENERQRNRKFNSLPLTEQERLVQREVERERKNFRWPPWGD